eukprot:10240561-Ditylum_brightwellii.AAC.1
MSSMPIDYDNTWLWENCCRTVGLVLLTTYCLGEEIKLCNGAFDTRLGNILLSAREKKRLSSDIDRD